MGFFFLVFWVVVFGSSHRRFDLDCSSSTFFKGLLMFSCTVLFLNILRAWGTCFALFYVAYNVFVVVLARDIFITLSR